MSMSMFAIVQVQNMAGKTGKMLNWQKQNKGGYMPNAELSS